MTGDQKHAAALAGADGWHKVLESASLTYLIRHLICEMATSRVRL